MMTTHEVRNLLRAACEAAGHQFAFSKQSGVSKSYITCVLRGQAEPGPKVLKALGLRRVPAYERIEQEAA